MQNQLSQLQQQVSDLQKQIDAIQDNFDDPTNDFAETIRDTITYDRDTTSPKSTTVTLGAGGGTFGVPIIPTLYLRIWFRGKLYNVPAISIS